MNFVEFVLEKLKDIPLELQDLKYSGIRMIKQYPYLLFVNDKTGHSIIGFENHTSVSVYDNDFIKIYNRIVNRVGASFIRKKDNSDEFIFHYQFAASNAISRNEIPIEALKICLALNINITSETIKSKVSENEIVTKLNF